MLDADSNTLDRKYNKLVVNPGAFHWRNDTFRKVNESNEDIVRFIASSWAGKDGRDVTEKNLLYYLYFSDPTIPEKQISATLAAIIAANAWCMKLEGQVGASPVTVFDWMRDRAHESPQTMNIVRMFCDYQLVIAFKYSARNKDWERHLTVIRLSQSIQATTHGITYVRMGFDLLQDATVCWSDMENQIIKDRLYVLQSEQGEWIEHDLVQEKHVRIVRENTGHEYRRGHQIKVEEAASAGISQANKQHTKHAIKRLGTEQGARLETTKTHRDWTQDKRAVKAFANTFLLLVNGKFFMKGLSNGEEDDTTLTSAIDGQPLDARQLDARLIGDEKVKMYGARYYIDSENVVERKEKDVGMAKISASSQKVSDKIDRL